MAGRDRGTKATTTHKSHGNRISQRRFEIPTSDKSTKTVPRHVNVPYKLKSTKTDPASHDDEFLSNVPGSPGILSAAGSPGYVTPPYSNMGYEVADHDSKSGPFQSAAEDLSGKNRRNIVTMAPLEPTEGTSKRHLRFESPAKQSRDKKVRISLVSTTQSIQNPHEVEVEVDAGFDSAIGFSGSRELAGLQSRRDVTGLRRRVEDKPLEASKQRLNSKYKDTSVNSADDSSDEDQVASVDGGFLSQLSHAKSSGKKLDVEKLLKSLGTDERDSNILAPSTMINRVTTQSPIVCNPQHTPSRSESVSFFFISCPIIRNQSRLQKRILKTVLNSLSRQNSLRSTPTILKRWPRLSVVMSNAQ